MELTKSIGCLLQKKKMAPIFGKYLLMQVNSSLEGKDLGKGEKELQLLLSIFYLAVD